MEEYLGYAEGKGLATEGDFPWGRWGEKLGKKK